MGYVGKWTGRHEQFNKQFHHISQGILNKTFQKLCHKVSLGMLSVFCDLNIFGEIMALCFSKYNTSHLLCLSVFG
jgi:hypothetical protein